MNVDITFAEGPLVLADCRLNLCCYGEVNALIRAACDQFHERHPDRSLLDGITITLQRQI